MSNVQTNVGGSDQLSSRPLKDLASNTKERTAIHFKTSEEAPFDLIASDYPLALAKALSGYTLKNVKQEQKIKIARQDLLSPAKSLLTIIAVSFGEGFQDDDGARVKQVFAWMKQVAKGNKGLPDLSGYPLYEHVRLLEVAELLEVPLLVEVLEKKVNYLSELKPAFDDVETLLAHYEYVDGHGFSIRRDYAVKAIAGAITQGEISETSPRLLTLKQDRRDLHQSLTAELMGMRYAQALARVDAFEKRTGISCFAGRRGGLRGGRRGGRA